MRKFISALALGTMVFVCAQRAYCCVCDPEVSPRQALRAATAVLVGRVTYMEVIYRKISDNSEKMSFVPEIQVKLEVEKIWKGAPNKVVIVRTSGGDCGYKFAMGGEYLVYAYDKDILTTSGCARTKLLAKAREDMKQIGRPRRTPWR